MDKEYIISVLHPAYKYF